MKYERRQVKRRSYTESFRQSVVDEIACGKLSIMEAVSHYDIPQTTVRSWCTQRQMDQPHVERIEYQMKADDDKRKELNATIADLSLELKVYKKMLELAGKDYGFDVKKNTFSGELELVKKKPQ